MIIAVTERGAFKRCQRQWNLTSKNGQHLTPVVVKPALNLGTLIHTAGDGWMLDPGGNFAEYVADAAVAMETSIKERYHKQVGAAISDAEMAPFYESVAMARQMAENYQTRWGSPLPDGFTLIQPEQKIQVPIPGSEHSCYPCEGTGGSWEGSAYSPNSTCPACGGDGVDFHYLEARLDALIQSKVDGAMWVFERKTYGQRPNLDSLQFNDQFLAYLWVLTQLKVAAVGGIAYDGLWKRAAVPRGRTFEDLFLRHTITRAPDELVEFEKLLLVEVQEMANVAQRKVYTINRRWEGCYDCGVAPICASMSRGEDYEQVIRLGFVQRTDDVEEPEESGE